MSSIMKYLHTLHNDPVQSDFQMTGLDENGQRQTLYLHKVIMMSRPFFKTYFETTIGDKNKSVMEVEDITIATVLTKYIYTESITPLSNENPMEALIDYTHLAMMWQLFDYRDAMMGILCNLLDKQIKLYKEIPLPLLTPCYLLFGTCPEITVTTGNMYMKFSGKDLINRLIPSIKNQKEKITLAMISSGQPSKDLRMQERPVESFQLSKDLLKHLDDDTFTEICVRLNAFNELILSETYTGVDRESTGTSRKRDLRYFRKHFDSYYKMDSRYFTPKQISLIRQSHYISQPGCGALYEGNNLIVDTFQPFCARFYTYVGRLQYNERNTLHLQMDISIHARLYINGSVYKIISMELVGLNEKVTEGYCANDYYVELQSLLEATPKLFRENVMVFKYHDYIGNDA